MALSAWLSAVSVWSIGSALSNNYSDNNENGSTKDTANALEREKQNGETDTADADAARQGENASGMVSGQLSGSFGSTPSDPDADKSSDGRLA
ncbi:hypothetical protein LP419_39635 [Massilia sp. H-1]|nr:hypothetical protein LP419_39635 [Massilia sp. H-1]